ncbi:MAG: hydrolase [Desulfuromonadaceae bacterium]|nr:hydrolase [Desulfuromonas sp.]MDY0185501.1 hydrolase [Desulfuromonadaceae bacterium]
MQKHPTILTPDNTVLLIIDVQERLVKAMANYAEVEKAITTLQQGMDILNLPTLITEQYPRGLGTTVESIAARNSSGAVVEKTTFSSCAEANFKPALKKLGRNQIVVTGMEAHVCVLQTVLDLLQAGYQVHVPIGAICSRNDQNRDNALRRMEQAGAIITNVESVLFELLHQAGSDQFKAISKLIV